MSGTVIKRDKTPNRRARRAKGRKLKGGITRRKGFWMRETPHLLDAHVNESKAGKADQ
jgi:hypothetical protein